MTDQGSDVTTEELAMLRHRAYSREGTSEDRDRLALLEAALSPVTPGEPGTTEQSVATEGEAPGDLPEDDDPERGADRTRRSSRVIALVAAAALLVGGFLGFGLGVNAASEQAADLLQEQPDLGVPGLRIFDLVNEPITPPAFDVESATGLDSPEVRDLATVDVTQVYIARGANAFAERKVCLIASGPSGDQVTCATEEDFVAGRGLALELGSFIVGWWPQVDYLLLAPG